MAKSNYCDTCKEWRLDCKCDDCLDGRLVEFAGFDCVIRKSAPPFYMLKRIEYSDHCYDEIDFIPITKRYALALVERQETP
jgi:hypothetical protein